MTGRRGSSSSSDEQESSAPTIGFLDPDLMECIFSDEEERASFVESCKASMKASCCHSQCQDVSDSDPDNADEVSYSSSLSSFQITNSGSFPLTEQSVSTFKPPSPLSSRHLSGLTPDSLLSMSQVTDSPEPSISDKSEQKVFSEPREGGFGEMVVLRPASQSSYPSNVQQPISMDKLQNASNYFPPSDLLEIGLARLRKMLPNPWIPIVDKTGFHLLLLSRGEVKSVQRDVFISFIGEVSIFVHCEPLSLTSDLLKIVDLPPVKFEKNSLELFCKRAHKIAQTTMQYKICVGGNHMESKDVWSEIPNTYADLNPFQEESYVQTCRSTSCSRLIELSNKLRCDPCDKVLRSLTHRAEFLLSESVHPRTPNIYMSSKQKLEKLRAQSDELKRRSAKIAYLRKKIRRIIDKDGVDVDESMHKDLSEILSRANVNEVQRMFLEEQMSCTSKSDSRAHRWHPNMIRLALYTRMVSSAANDASSDFGAIKLPSQKTLFDYSHAFAPQAGFSDELLNIVKKVSGLKESHQKFVALLVDEMYVCKNLVYKQSDGSLIGYVHLNEVEEEFTQLENFLNGKESESCLQFASKILTYMVKGLASNFKYVIASYPCNQIGKDVLYARSWEVVSRLERAGIKVLALVCDGSSVNRGFIAMHTPLTKTLSGIVFDSLNFCSPDRRPLFFIFDVAQLIKTIRNCFYNSGEGEKKVRCLKLNGQKIEWKTIIRLYLTYKQCNVRKSFKLNSQNVFPNAVSCMNAKHAAHVLSQTVATDIELQNWPDTEETVKFIRRWNKFLDCMNGLNSYEHILKKSPDREPYTDVNDPRFEWLESCIKYLEDWKKQVEELDLPPEEKERMQLSFQVRHGIEMSVRGFSGAVKYLIEQGAKVFPQDLPKNYVSKQRAKAVPM